MKLKQIRVDGYKNLIDCKLELGDFNVLVGPNNSGKSNLLEAVQILWPICFGDEKLRARIFQGITPPFRWGSSICHLEKHENKPMTIGISFETNTENRTWDVDYEVKIKCDYNEKSENAGFLSEILKATNPSKTGPVKNYIRREEKILDILGKEYPIAKGNSSLLAIRSLYPDFKDLPAEFRDFYESINRIGKTQIFSLSPQSMRRSIDTEGTMRGLYVSSFNLPIVIDDIQKDGKYYELFKASLSDILDLDYVNLKVDDIKIPDKTGETGEKTQRVRFLFVGRKKDVSIIDEYSDGTLTVASILAALLSDKIRGPIMFIEEAENYLHPAAIKKLLTFLQDHADKWPILITTHSPFLLNIVKKAEDVNVAVVDETGATHFEKIRNTKQLRDYLKSGFMSFGDLLVSNFDEVLGGK